MGRPDIELGRFWLGPSRPPSRRPGFGRPADWLADLGDEEAVLSREVRLVLVAAGFDRAITTTVLWLTDM